MRKKLLPALLLAAVCALISPPRASAQWDPRDWDILPDIPDLPKWLTDPFGYVLDLFVDLYEKAADAFDKLILDVPYFYWGQAQQELMEMSWGLALSLGTTVLLITIAASVFAPKRMAPKILSSGIFLVLLVQAPLFFRLGEAINSFINELCTSLAFNGSDKPLLFMPTIDNVLGAIAATASVTSLGGLILLFFVAYVIINIFATILLLPMFALRPLGIIPEQLYGWLVGMGFVALTIGRPIAVLELSIGSAIGRSIPDDVPSIVPLFVVLITLVAVLVTQFFLVVWSYNVYAKATGGQVYSTSRIKGTVSSTIKKGLRVSYSRATAQMLRTLKPNLGRNTPTSTATRTATSRTSTVPGATTATRPSTSTPVRRRTRAERMRETHSRPPLASGSARRPSLPKNPRPPSSE